MKDRSLIDSTDKRANSDRWPSVLVQSQHRALLLTDKLGEGRSDPEPLSEERLVLHYETYNLDMVIIHLAASKYSRPQSREWPACSPGRSTAIIRRRGHELS